MKRAFVLAVVVALAATMVQTATGGPSARWAVCGEWRQVPVPDPSAIGGLRDVAVVSPYEAWAVGELGAEEPTGSLVLHWTGMRWEQVAFPKVAFLNAVTVVSPTEVWVVGSRAAGMGAQNHPFAARWLGGRWESVPIRAPIRGRLDDVTAVPGTRQLWAVGTLLGSGKALSLHWTGRAWQRVSTNLDRGASLNGVVAFRDTVWAVGSSAGERMLSLRWNGEGWHRISAPRGYASAIDGLAPDRLWAVGGALSDRPGYSRPAVFRWNGERWHRAWVGDAHGNLNDVVVPAPGVVWGVGSRSSKAPYQPLIVRLRSHGWHSSTIRGAEGWLWGIDGTPNNLWMTHAHMVDPHGSEPAYFDTYHRC